MRTKPLARHRNEEHRLLKDQLEDTFNSWCSIERLTETPNDSGGMTEVWAVPTGLNRIACAFNSKSLQGENVVADQIGANKTYYVHLPAQTVIYHSDRIVINEVRYEVIGIPEPVSVEVARLVEVKWVE